VRSGSLFAAGTVFCLVAFLQPAVPVLLAGGTEALEAFEPTAFWWWLYVPGLALMTTGLGLAYRFRIRSVSSV
jgi:ABC-type dipeptide/oligopeptide/nickel transport system permease subunit